MPFLDCNNIIIKMDCCVIEIVIERFVEINLIKDTLSPSFGVLKESITADLCFSFNDYRELITLIKWH